MTAPRVFRLILIAPLVLLAAAFGGDDDPKPEKPGGPLLSKAAPVDSSMEADVTAFVRENHPELATVLEALKPMNPSEYRKAITELAGVRKNLIEVKAKNPRRYELLLDGWKTKSRVELLAARLAGSPSDEVRSQLRQAIEARLDAEIRRQRYELEQAEAAAKKVRERLDRLENQRDDHVADEKESRRRRDHQKRDLPKPRIEPRPQDRRETLRGGRRPRHRGQLRRRNRPSEQRKRQHVEDLPVIERRDRPGR